jgi:glycosyltransferase involved in cell wall biosynthesis
MLTAETGKPTASRLYETGLSGEQATVAVIIPTFNHASFLAGAITSVLAQTHRADEIIVVDDGSTDDPAAVVAQFPEVRLVRQDNRGLSGARNTGLRSCTTDYVAFLDADDFLLPVALERGLACFADHPDCVFVYGGHRITSGDGQAISPDSFHQVGSDAHLALLRRGNQIVSIASVLFRRSCLVAENGFDETLRRCEDYDLFLRLTYRYRIAGYPSIVTEYRKHRENMSNDHLAQLETVLAVLNRHEGRIALDPPTRLALREGRAHLAKFYAAEMLVAALDRWRERRDSRAFLSDVLKAMRLSPSSVLRRSLGTLARRAFKQLPSPIARCIQRLRGYRSRV